MAVTGLSIFMILVHLHDSVSATTCSNYKECTGNVINNDVHCTGLSSCSESTIDTTDSIECTAQTSCYKAKGLSSQDKIFCDGYKSCRYSQSLIAQNNIQCNGWASCDHEKNTNDYTFTSNTNIQCSGSSSCQYNTMKSNKNTLCDGDRSCFQTVINSGSHIYCDGNKSCGKSKLTATHVIDCSSKGGCYGSKIIGNTLNAYGMYSAHKSVISASTINAFGYYSISDSIIDSKDIDIMEVNALGEKSGYRANVICRKGSECVVVCQGNGCNGMSFVCEIGAKCNVWPENCDDDNSENCPDMVYANKNDGGMDELWNMGNVKQNDLLELDYKVLNNKLFVNDMVYNLNGNGSGIMGMNVYVNMLSGFIVCLVTIMIVDRYFRRKYGDKE